MVWQVLRFEFDKNIPRKYHFTLSLATGESWQEVFYRLVFEVNLSRLLHSGFGLNEIPDIGLKIHFTINKLIKYKVLFFTLTDPQIDIWQVWKQSK